MLKMDDKHALEVEEKNSKYKHVILATSDEISTTEAYRLANENDDDILFVLALNKSPAVTKDVLEIALHHATAETVKTRIERAIGDKS